MKKVTERMIHECQKIIEEKDYIMAMFIHDKIVKDYFHTNQKVLMKLSKHKYFLGLVTELDYINDLRILQSELIRNHRNT